MAPFSVFIITNPNMKRIPFLVTLLLVLSHSFVAKAQTKEQCIRFLQAKAEEIKDQIKIRNNSRFVVEESSFSMENNRVELLFQSNSGMTITNFCPADIDRVESGNITASSPVGVLVIHFKSQLAESQYKERKREDKPTLEKVAYFNYLQKDPKNEEQIKKMLLRLKELVEEETDKAPLLEALGDNATAEPIWQSIKPNSYTYELTDLYYGGGELKLYYSMEEVTLKSTSKSDYAIIIPMTEVDEVILDKRNAKPASVWLKSGKDNFRIFKKDAKGEKYVFEKATDYTPLFVKYSNDIDQLALEMDIEDTKKACGGGKIKTRVIK